MAIIAQMSVPRTSRISIADKRLFFNPNCRGVKAKLKIKFRINGKATMSVICFCHTIKNTLPNDTVIKIYKKVHIGPKSQAGGAHVGFISLEYQLYVFIDLF